ncbi:MAG: hypothetical protein ACK4UO_15700 [Pseudolabrys sp.]
MQIVKRHLRWVVVLAALAVSAAVAAQAQIQRASGRQEQAPPPPPPSVRSAPAPATFPQRAQVPAQPAVGGAADVPLPMPAPGRAPQQVQAPQQGEASPGSQAAPPEIRGGAITPKALNMFRTGPEEIGEVPNHFFWIREGLQAVQDATDGQFVFLSDEGRVLGRATLPKNFEIADIIGDKDAIRLLDPGGRAQVSIPRNVDPAVTMAFQEQTIASNGGARTMRLRRVDRQHLVYHDERRSNGRRALDVRSLAGGTLAQAYEVGPGHGDSRYLVSEEIVAARPLTVRVFVQRFDRAGRLTGVVHVPLDGMDAVPRNFIDVTGGGQVRVLVPAPDSIKIREVEFAAPPAAGRQSSNEALKSLGRTLREITVESNILRGPRAIFRNESAPPVQIEASTPPITRSKVIEIARSYLTVNWVMQPENYEKSGIENACVPDRYKLWLRPRRFTRDLIGTTIGPMPYRWAGEDTPQTFRLRTELGALAGDICTCRILEFSYCTFPEAAGVDCSGFVSRAWGIEKRGTSGLLDVADDLDSIEALKPGDAFDWPQRHVRLFTEMAPGAAIAFTVLESTTRLECEGVCERTYRPSELAGYRLIRYRGITDEEIVAQPAVAPQPQQNGAPPVQQTASPPAPPNGTAQAKPNGTAPNGATQVQSNGAAQAQQNGGAKAKRSRAKEARQR